MVLFFSKYFKIFIQNACIWSVRKLLNIIDWDSLWHKHPNHSTTNFLRIFYCYSYNYPNLSQDFTSQWKEMVLIYSILAFLTLWDLKIDLFMRHGSLSFKIDESFGCFPSEKKKASAFLLRFMETLINFSRKHSIRQHVLSSVFIKAIIT